jgi:molybdopterin-binding protein
MKHNVRPVTLAATICLALSVVMPMPAVTVRVGDHIIESVITRRSAEEMLLKKGDTVTAVVKATEVMLAKG